MSREANQSFIAELVKKVLPLPANKAERDASINIDITDVVIENMKTNYSEDGKRIELIITLNNVV